MRYVYSLLFTLIWVVPFQAHAQCAAPPAEAGVIIFNADHKVMQYCNGTQWVGLWGGAASTHWMKNGNDLYYNDGNVGIGILNPQAKLSVNGHIQYADGKGHLNYYRNGPYNQIELGATDPAISVSLFTNSISRLNITPTGDVGIGTVAPQAKLHVLGEARVASLRGEIPPIFT